MSQELLVALVGALFAIVTFYNKAKAFAQIIGLEKKTDNKLLDKVNQEEHDKFVADFNLFKAEFNVLKNWALENIQARLEITNDPEEQKELLDKLKQFNDLFGQ